MEQLRVIGRHLFQTVSWFSTVPVMTLNVVFLNCPVSFMQ
jgi:hypothetical protein